MQAPESSTEMIDKMQGNIEDILNDTEGLKSISPELLDTLKAQWLYLDILKFRFNEVYDWGIFWRMQRIQNN